VNLIARFQDTAYNIEGICVCFHGSFHPFLHSLVVGYRSFSFKMLAFYMKWAVMTLATAQLGAAQTYSSCNPTKSEQ
jgi:hypothetical protein